MSDTRLDVTEQRLTTVEETLKLHGQKLDKIIMAVQQQQSGLFDPYKVLNFITQATILLGLVASGIIYIAGNMHGERLAVLESKITVIQHKGDKVP
jgi:hypothetical protein